MHIYNVFGFQVYSELEISGLSQEITYSGIGTPISVQVKRGRVATSLPNSKPINYWSEFNDEECLFRLQNDTRILVSPYNEITVDSKDSSNFSEVIPYLVGCGLCTIGVINNLIPLHIGAVLTQEGAWLFCGNSGAGKSTLSVALAATPGVTFLCDDLAMYHPVGTSMGGERGRLFFGVETAKLWQDSLSMFDNQLEIVSADPFRPHKSIVACRSHNFIDALQVRNIYWLTAGEELKITKISASSTFVHLMNSVIPAPVVAALGSAGKTRSDLLDFCRNLSGYELSRNFALHDIGQVVSAIGLRPQ